MKRAVVTGANGFVGAAVCAALAEKNIEVFAVVRNEQEDIACIDKNSRIHIVYCDMCDVRELPRRISDREIDVFFHFAWTGSAGPLRADADVQQNNIIFTCHALKACHELGCSRFVFASSIMVYEIMALMENDKAPTANTLYSCAKLSADFMARTLAAQYGIDYIRGVISNIYGPGETSERLINSSLRKMLAGEYCRFSPGNQMYDFIYISDAAEAFAAIGEKGKPDKTYYIGSQKPAPLKEFLIEMRNQVDPLLEIGIGDLPFNGVSLTYQEFDINAVKEDTGFAASVSFSTGIQNTIKWMRGEAYE